MLLLWGVLKHLLYTLSLATDPQNVVLLCGLEYNHLIQTGGKFDDWAN